MESSKTTEIIVVLVFVALILLSVLVFTVGKQTKREMANNPAQGGIVYSSDNYRFFDYGNEDVHLFYCPYQGKEFGESMRSFERRYPAMELVSVAADRQYPGYWVAFRDTRPAIRAMVQRQRQGIPPGY